MENKNKDHKLEEKLHDAKTHEKVKETTEKKEESKKSEEHKTEHKKDKKPEVKKKDESVAIGKNLHLSKKHGMYICNYIKGKNIDAAIKELEEVKKLKRAIPFKGEIPHRKGMMSGRYPVNGAEVFIGLLKGLRGNVIVNGMDLDKTKIYIASTSWASRPMRTQGRQAKRSYVILKAREIKGGKE